MSPPTNSEKSQAKEAGHQDHEIEGEDNEWKFREPYMVHDNTRACDDTDSNGKDDGNDKGGRNGEGNEGGGEREAFKALYEGECHCGRVKYQLSREKPLSCKFCHCGTCQVLHGAPFQWAAIFHKSDINFLKGHHDLTWYDPGEKTIRHKLPCKVSCSYCGSRIMDEGRNMILLFPELIRFKGVEERERFGAQCHMFYSERVVDIKDGLPKWSGMSGKSELIEDSPPEAIKKRKREIEGEEREAKEGAGKKASNGKSE